jgi:pimeloyl-ACP methyl ester carboxylesterase
VLTRLLRAKTSATRGQLADDDAIDDDWTTADIVFHVERGGVTKALPIGAIDQPLWVGKIAITQKPAALIGKITVESFEADAHRGVGEGIVLPPALTLHPELCQLIGGADTRSVGDAGLVVKIDVDETTRTAVSPTSPLILDVRQLDPSAETLAVMHDGEDFLLVGGGEKGLVTINALPEDRARTRANVVRSLRLYLFKKIGQYTPELGLHYFERGGDVSKPRLPTRADFKPGDTVALMVHGFLSDTGWMADDVADFLRKDVLDYDHVLGWDYETVGTGINQNGEGLAKELRRRCGFGANDGITVHLFAHSMGCVVSRCMIELHGGDKFIDKALFAGAPNLGTRAADATRGLAYLITLLLNNVSIIPGPSWLGKAVAAGFGWLVNNATGWSDLKTNSDILKEINELDEPNTTPYLVLAGLNKRQDQAAGQAERIAVKLLDQGLDAFYGEDNDIVIGKHCMTDMRMGTYPLLTVQTLSCDHGAYFVDTAGRETITTWVTKQPM